MTFRREYSSTMVAARLLRSVFSTSGSGSGVRSLCSNASSSSRVISTSGPGYGASVWSPIDDSCRGRVLSPNADSSGLTFGVGLSPLLKPSSALLSCCSTASKYWRNGIAVNSAQAAPLSSLIHSVAHPVQHLMAAPGSCLQMKKGSSTSSTDLTLEMLKGTTNVCLQDFGFVFVSADSLGYDANGEVSELDIAKIYTFEGCKGLEKVLMMYSGNCYYPAIIRDSMWKHELLIPSGRTVDAATCASFVAKWMEDNKDAELIKHKGSLPPDIAKLFGFFVTFVSVGVKGPKVSVYDCRTGELEHNRGDFIVGHGESKGNEYYNKYYASYFDAFGLEAAAYEKYVHDYALFSMMDIMVECSKVEKDPCGGIIRIFKATATGTERVWQGHIDLLRKKRAAHWLAERKRKADGEILSPIELD